MLKRRQQRSKFRLALEILLYYSVPLLLCSSAVVSVAAPPKQIAQFIPQDSINRPTLQLGSQGQPVTELQAALKLLGFYQGAVDGVYNEITAKAVSQFQQAAGLNPNGIVDTTTWQKLFPSEAMVASDAALPNSANSFPVPTQTAKNPKTVSSTPEPKPAKPPRQPTPANSQNKPVVQSSLYRIPKTTHTQQTTRSQQPSQQPSQQKITYSRQNTALIQPTPRTQQIPGIQYTAEGFPILRPGMRGLEVVKLQQQLQKLGYLKSAIDGDFGQETQSAVIALQKRYALEADGVVGGATWKILLQRR